MENKSLLNNAIIEGEICSEPRFIHEQNGKRFYLFEVGVKRLSGKYDYIKCIINEDTLFMLFDNSLVNDINGTFVRIKGSYRSYNIRKPKLYQNKVLLSVYVKEIEVLDHESHYNKIYLNGYVCKRPVFRTTPMKREITDVYIAVHRPNGKSDYIPCICWERNAKLAEELKVGDAINIIGRIESRDYIKETDNGERITKTTYEVSVSKFDIIDEDKERVD